MSSSSTSTDQSTLTELQIGEYTIAVISIIVLSFIERNRKGKRPGLLEPLNFLQDDNLSLVYGAAFGCTAYEIVYGIFQIGSFTSNLNISPFVRPWIRVLVWLFIALLTSVKIYPVLASIRCKRLLVDPLIGFFYIGYSTGIFSYNLYQQTTFKAIIVAYIPTLVCYSVLLCYFLYNGVYHMLALIRHDVTDFSTTKHRCASKYQSTYVKWLLRKPDRKFETSVTGVKRSVEAIKFEIRLKLGLTSPLRASPRVIATFIMAAIALFQIGLAELIFYAWLTPSTRFPSLLLQGSNSTFNSVLTFFTVIDAGFYISFSISSIFITVYICTLFLNYRKDLEKLYRGDHTFLPMKLRKSLNDNLVAASLRYSGMQIAYLVWCYVLFLLVIWIGCFLVAYIVILPLTGDAPFWLFEPVPLLLPGFLINFAIRKGQIFLSRRMFLQDHFVTIQRTGKTQRAMGLDNIKSFNILTFFMFFLYAIIGLISCMSRILIGLAIGLVSLARIDRCMLPRGFEKWDKGYSTYVGMIMVELFHRNPVLTVFCDELLAVSDKNRYRNVLLESVESDKKLETTNQKYRRVCRKWQKAYTLLKNPSIRKVPCSSECSIEQVEVQVKC